MPNLIKKIETGQYTVLDSGVVLLDGKNNNIKFSFNDMILEIIFLTSDDKNKKNDILTYFTELDKNYIKIECTNCETPPEIGMSSPIQLMTEEDWIDIYFTFTINNLNSMPVLTYSFYSKG